MLSAEVNVALDHRPDLTLVKLADAAHDNWSYLDELAPQADSSTDLVDFFHAAEQLKAATDAAYGENDVRGRAQYEKYRHLLRHEPGGVERVIRGLHYLRSSTDGGSGFGKCWATFAVIGTGCTTLRRPSAGYRSGLE